MFFKYRQDTKGANVQQELPPAALVQRRKVQASELPAEDERAAVLGDNHQQAHAGRHSHSGRNRGRVHSAREFRSCLSDRRDQEVSQAVRNAPLL